MSTKQKPSKEVSETRVWEWMEQARKAAGDWLHMSRVENLVGAGDADVTGCLRGGHFDIEIKSASRPSYKETAIIPIASDPRKAYIRATQKIWHRARWTAGGQNFILLQIGRERDVMRMIFRGADVREIEGRDESGLHDLAIFTSIYGEVPLDVIEFASTFRR